QRVERHERAAAWVEQLAADRDDRAELIAHHLTTALGLRDALGHDASTLRVRTLAALVAATRQAAARHDPEASIALADKALALDQPPGPMTSLPAYFAAYRLIVQGRYADALALAGGEIERARAAGNDQAAALLLVWHGSARVGLGDAAGTEDMREAYRSLDR